MKYLNLLFIFFNCNIIVTAQCNEINITLNSQAQIDSFNTKYANCTEFYSIEIDDKFASVKNLDSLINIKRVYSLKILKMDSLSDISGLNNIISVNDFTFYQSKKFEPILTLDTIGSLRHYFLSDTIDLSFYSNIKHIKESLSINFSGSLVGLNNYTSGSKFSIFINENKIKNDCKKILPQNSTILEHFSVRKCAELSLSGLEKIVSIVNVTIEDNQSCDFSSISGINNCNQLFIISQPLQANVFPIFINLDTIFRLALSMPSLEKLDIILPKLKHIRGYLTLSGCTNLENLNYLNDFSLPYENSVTSSLYKYRVIIVNNLNLQSCINDFICRAITHYPDSVYLENNGSFCDKFELIRHCTSNTSIYNSNHFKIYPNPNSGMISIDGIEREANIIIRDINGQTLSIVATINNLVDISDLPKGIYIFDIRFNEIIESHRIVKIE
jgi:hypothetical protein